MKKLILIIVILLWSCSKDDVECLCDLKVQFEQSDGELGIYFVENVPTDCNGGFTRPQNIPEDHFLSIYNCN